MSQSEISYKVDADTRPFRSKMDGLKKTAKDTGDMIVGSFKGMGAAILGAFSVQSTRQLIAWADALGDVAEAAGVSAEFLQKWQRVNAGTDIGMSTKALEKFADQIGEAQRGEGAFLKVLDSLGISLRDKEGRLKSIEQVLFEYTDAIKNAKTEQQALSLASEAFGVKNKQLVSSLKEGSDALKAQMKDMKVLGNDQVEMMAEVNRMIEISGENAKVAGANWLSWYHHILRFYSRIKNGGTLDDAVQLGSFSAPENLKNLTKLIEAQAEAKQHALDQEAAKEKEILETKKKQTEEQKKQADKLRETLAKERDRLIVLGEQLRAKYAAAMVDKERAERDRFGLTVNEAANPEGNRFAARFGLSRQGQQNVADARRVQELEEFARFARMNQGPTREQLAQQRFNDRGDRIMRRGKYAPGGGPLDLEREAAGIVSAAPGDGMAATLEAKAAFDAGTIRSSMESLSGSERAPTEELLDKLEEIRLENETLRSQMIDWGIQLRAP